MIERPTTKVDANDIPAVAAGILKLIEDPRNHCKYAFARDANAWEYMDPIKYTDTTPLEQICLATAFTFVTGVEIPPFALAMDITEMAAFGEAVFGRKNLCHVNNHTDHESLIMGLKEAAAKQMAA